MDAKQWLTHLLVLTLSTGLSPMSEQVAAAREGKAKPAGNGPLILVMNYPYQITGSAKTKIHAVLFKPDFSPAAGAVAKVNGKEVCRADDNGTCIFDYVPGENKSHSLVATLKEGGKSYRVVKSFASNARTASFRSDQLFVYTDRGVYNPGDNILVRVMAWELLGDYSALDRAKVKLLFQNSSGKVFAGEELETNEFGVAATKLPVSENLPEGDYELVVLYNKARETARLRVKRFVPPVMNIVHDIRRFLTPAQQSLTVVANVSFFAGGIPEGAVLKLKVEAGDSDPVLTRDFSADKLGRFELTLNQADLDKIRQAATPEQPFKMVLEATDGFQRTTRVTRDVVYTERPYRAVLELDKDDYPSGELVKLQAKVVDLDGKPARDIALTCDVAEFNVSVHAVTDSSGVAEFSFQMGKTAGTAVVRSALMKLPLGEKAVRLNRPKPMTSKVAEPPQKQGVQTRITVTFDKRYRPIEKVVHVDFTDLSGALVVATTIPVTRGDGEWLAEGTVTAPAWGTMLANLYVCAVKMGSSKKVQKLGVQNVGFITEGQHVTLYPDAQAEIRFEGLKPRVHPGEELRVTVSVKNPKGGDSSVGAMLVDNAVVSLLDPLEVSPADHFYNPQRKVISTGGAGVLTWPVVDRTWGTPWRDIAYTDWGWKAPGALVNEGGNGDMDEEGEMVGGAAMKGAGGSGGGGFGAGTVSGIGSAGSKKMKMKMAGNSSMAASLMAAAPAPKAEMAMDSLKSEDGDGTVDRRSRNGEASPPSPPRQITIRTRFPETALWEPLLRTRGGKTTFKIQFPDAITIQRLTVVSNGKLGGLGLEHKAIEVRQDLFVQADVPAALAMGDVVSIVAVVQNHSGADVTASVVPTASGLTLLNAAPETLAIKAGDSVAVAFKVRADFVGKVEFSVAVNTDAASDIERRSFTVRPAGEPVTTVVRGEVSAASAFDRELVVQDGAAHTSAIVAVSFPNVVPAIQAWQAMAEYPMAYVGVSGVASRAILDVALLEHARVAGLPESARKELVGRLQRAAAELVAAQNSDGSWGWFYQADASSPGGFVVSVYLSAYALKALVALAQADVMVEPQALTRGVQFLMDSRNGDGLWSPTAWFWEVNAPETDWGLTGDLLETVIRASHLTAKTPDKEVVKLAERCQTFLAGRPENPGAVAHILGALVAMEKWQKLAGRTKLLKGGLDYLVSLKRQGHWEPHWYHAYGGMIELNARILDLLSQVDGEGHEALRYELVTWLLSTREAWGAWHNEIGTANAVRALLAAGAVGPAEKAATVTVLVNGKAVASVAVDPADVFLSAANLRFVDVSSYLVPGKNRVEVSYDGNLVAPVALELKQWPVRRKAAATRQQLTIARTSPEVATVGEPIPVALTLSAAGPLPFVEIIDAIPATTTVDKDSLEALVKAGTIQGYHIGEGQLGIFMARLEGEVTLKYTLVATRAGVAVHGGARAQGRFHPQVGPAMIVDHALSVR
jgi:hypothetical protein